MATKTMQTIYEQSVAGRTGVTFPDSDVPKTASCVVGLTQESPKGRRVALFESPVPAFTRAPNAGFIERIGCLRSSSAKDSDGHEQNHGGRILDGHLFYLLVHNSDRPTLYVPRAAVNGV